MADASVGCSNPDLEPFLLVGSKVWPVMSRNDSATHHGSRSALATFCRNVVNAGLTPRVVDSAASGSTLSGLICYLGLPWISSKAFSAAPWAQTGLRVCSEDHCLIAVSSGAAAEAAGPMRPSN